MGFCGKHEHEQRWKMLGFAMHCSSLAHCLVDLKYNRMSSDENGQTRLFQMTSEQREGFLKFAANLRFLIGTWSSERTEEYWKELGKHEYTDYEFCKMFDPFYKDRTEAVTALLEKIGNGEQLSEEESKSAVDFLHMLSARAHANVAPGGF